MEDAARRDEAFMARALELARARLGRTAPNPAVGCILVKGAEVIAEAATGEGGRPHAEEAALAAAGERARGAVAYVSLEPCSARSGGGLSCAGRLIAAGVAEVVYACAEPHAASAGGGALLAAAGVAVRWGVREADARRLNCGFFKRIASGRPWLAIDPVATGYDAEFQARPGEALEATLGRLGAEGWTRVRVAPESSQRRALEAAGLVDEDLSGENSADAHPPA